MTPEEKDAIWAGQESLRASIRDEMGHEENVETTIFAKCAWTAVLGLVLWACLRSRPAALATRAPPVLGSLGDGGGEARRAARGGLATGASPGPEGSTAPRAAAVEGAAKVATAESKATVESNAKRAAMSVAAVAAAKRAQRAQDEQAAAEATAKMDAAEAKAKTKKQAEMVATSAAVAKRAQKATQETAVGEAAEEEEADKTAAAAAGPPSPGARGPAEEYRAGSSSLGDAAQRPPSAVEAWGEEGGAVFVKVRGFALAVSLAVSPMTATVQSTMDAFAAATGTPLEHLCYRGQLLRPTSTLLAEAGQVGVQPGAWLVGVKRGR